MSGSVELFVFFISDSHRIPLSPPILFSHNTPLIARNTSLFKAFESNYPFQRDPRRRMRSTAYKNGFPFVEVTCFLVEVTCFFLKSDLQNDRSLAEPCGALRVTFLFEKSLEFRTEPFTGHY